jgi:prepilin-type N-terminal cleavage/methylation domain-containing protein
MFKTMRNGKVSKGVTLVELAVVVVLIGVLAAFGLPRYIKSVEQSKASEAFAYLSAVRAAQERYHAREGTYTSDLALIDIQIAPSKYFVVGSLQPAGGVGGTLETSWSLTLTRSGPSAGHGAYTVIFNQDGYDTTSTINAHPDINPMSTDPSSDTVGS